MLATLQQLESHSRTILPAAHSAYRGLDVPLSQSDSCRVRRSQGEMQRATVSQRQTARASCTNEWDCDRRRAEGNRTPLSQQRPFCLACCAVEQQCELGAPVSWQFSSARTQTELFTQLSRRGSVRSLHLASGICGMSSIPATKQRRGCGPGLLLCNDTTTTIS